MWSSAFKDWTSMLVENGRAGQLWRPCDTDLVTSDNFRNLDSCFRQFHLQKNCEGWKGTHKCKYWFVVCQSGLTILVFKQQTFALRTPQFHTISTAHFLTSSSTIKSNIWLHRVGWERREDDYHEQGIRATVVSLNKDTFTPFPTIFRWNNSDRSWFA